MGIFGDSKGRKGGKKNRKSKPVVKTRKELRKDKRKQKKNNRAEYYQKKNQPGKYALNPDQGKQAEKETKPVPRHGDKASKKVNRDPEKRKHDLEIKKQLRLEKEMEKNRKVQLKEANIAEDKIIKQLEKNLKLNKRKSKSIPKSFETDGLNYVLEMCDDKNRQLAVETEKRLLAAENESGSEFEDDFNMITKTKIEGEKKKRKKKMSESSDLDDDDDFDDLNDLDDEEDVSSDDYSDVEEEELPSRHKTEDQSRSKKRKADVEDEGSSSPRKKVSTKIESLDIESEDSEDDDLEDQDILAGSEDEENSDGPEDGAEEENSQLWEDIYGRTRDKQGNVVSSTSTEKYVPPGAREKKDDPNAMQNEKLIRLRKQVKGLLNRLAEHNMHNIATQLDELYMSNSRNDMNEMLFHLMRESIVAPVLTPDRLITEHMMLIAILHANIGTEVGAHFLLSLVKEFEKMLMESPEVENKELDNVILMISHLYNFKVFDSQLLFQMLEKLSANFMEKEVELILHILKTVGFVMRKDNPTMLKDFIFKLQQKAQDTTENTSRVQFMLDILLAIKNNNMTKIPQYDPTHVEHLKKLMRTLIRKGNYVTQLNISLDDLMKADQRGKWWVVGSAWTGNIDSTKPVQKSDPNATTFSQKILDLARKQRMNTDIRRNIFCVLMTAEDYLDAFEKLHHLGLKNQQEREVIYVILDCCLQEKIFNPYYAVLAQKFCDYDRKYQMTIQYTLWDKLKTLESYTNNQLTNLARFLTHLFIEKGLPLSVLKVVQFGELDKPTLKLVRQIMLGILLHENTEACTQVFERISLSPQLQNFREGLRLFIRHFLLKNVKVGVIPEAEMFKLRERAKIADKSLTAHGSKTVF